MNAKAPDRQSAAGAWVAFAERDAAAAQALLAAGPMHVPAAAFLCQQAAEKLLKAALTACGAEFPRTHDLEDLADRVARAAPALAVDAGALVYVDNWDVEYRYPDFGGLDAPPLTVSDVEQGLAAVGRFFAALRASPR
jgi:HEPN domain-containing protein